MLTRKQEINLQLNQLLDALLLGLIFWLCHLVRDANLVNLDLFHEIPPFEEFIWILAVVMPFGPFLLEMHGYYQYPLEKNFMKSLGQIAQAGIWLGLIIGLCVIFGRLQVPSRSVLILFTVIAPVALLIKERLVAAYYLKRLKEGAVGERILIAGERRKMEELLASFTETQRLEIQVMEMIDLKTHGVDALIEALHRHSVGRVILTFEEIELSRVQIAIEACEVEGVEAWLNADFIRTSVARPTYEQLGRRPMLVFRATPEISWAMVVKSLIDRVGAATILLLASPVMIMVALIIKLSAPHAPIIFRQQRSGRYGQPFTMLKFRSMVVDAEEKRCELEQRNEMSGPVFKVENDPRITPFGRWIRKTSIDELPQLFNVLKGDMSLVGPRPLPVYEVEKFESRAHRRRLSMKPGLTCIWQIRGRNQVKNFNDWVKMDLEYIDNWSLGLDFYILLKTIPVVVFGLGAK